MERCGRCNHNIEDGQMDRHLFISHNPGVESFLAISGAAIRGEKPAAGERDFILEGLEKMVTDYSGLELTFNISGVDMPFKELLEHVKSNTEIGVKFKADIINMVLAFMSNFTL